jgi:hypothetical protein
MGQVDALLEANRRFAAGFDKGDAQLPPNKPIAVLNLHRRTVAALALPRP